jgi:hypothetical protein
LVAEELVIDGSNEIELLLPYGDSWMSGSADALTLELIDENGNPLKLVSEGNRRIQVDKVERAGDAWVVQGWAADVANKVPPDLIYVYAGERLLGVGPPNEDNANVVRWFGSDDLLRSGFALEIGLGDVGDDVDQLTVVAEFGDVAIADPAPLSQ